MNDDNDYFFIKTGIIVNGKSDFNGRVSVEPGTRKEEVLQKQQIEELIEKKMKEKTYWFKIKKMLGLTK